jgi:hypothetical protein
MARRVIGSDRTDVSSARRGEPIRAWVGSTNRLRSKQGGLRLHCAVLPLHASGYDLLDFLPPLRPAAFFCAVLPPLPLPELLRL